MLELLALGGVLLGQSATRGAEKKSGAGPRYPDEKTLAAVRREGWVVEYRKADVRREGVGVRAPSAVAPERYVVTPCCIEAQFVVQGKWHLVMPTPANTCNQTCLATRLEVEVEGKLLKPGTDYTLQPLATRPLGNRFWQIKAEHKEKSSAKVRVLGLVSNAAAPTDLGAAQSKIAEVAGQDKEVKAFDRKYKVAPIPHWLTKPSKEVQEAVAGVVSSETKDRFASLKYILREMHKKGKLTKGMSRDPEDFVKDGMKGSCGANADFVNLAATTAGLPYLYYTEGYVIVPKLNYGGLHVWNTACCNGFFIADSLNPDLIFPEYSMYVATSIGPNVNHPAKANGSTSGGWMNAQYYNNYYVYFSLPGYGNNGAMLSKLTVPEGIQQLGEFVAHQRTKVNKR
jgi:hypothetical protein